MIRRTGYEPKDYKRPRSTEPEEGLRRQAMTNIARFVLPIRREAVPLDCVDPESAGCIGGRRGGASCQGRTCVRSGRKQLTFKNHENQVMELYEHLAIILDRRSSSSVN